MKMYRRCAPSGLVRAMAVSVMQMTTTRPTGTFSTHFAQRLLSTSVSLYLCLSHLAALRLNPGHPDAHRELAKLAVTEQRYEDAIVHLESLVKALPWDPIALCELGTLHANLQRFERARVCLERAVWINPNYPPARENLRILQSLMDAKR